MVRYTKVVWHEFSLPHCKVLRKLSTGQYPLGQTDRVGQFALEDMPPYRVTLASKGRAPSEAYLSCSKHNSHLQTR
jgi:hypothetical protein